jgi:phosphatidylserine decarboxylase
MIRAFIGKFDICMDDFVHKNPKDYSSFNDFFTRPLKEGMRPLPLDGSLICSPVDGKISQVGEIKADRIIQAKKHDYSLTALLGGDHQLAEVFNNGL